VGWRFVDGDDVIDLRAHPKSGWRDLPDDRRRFYADPFPIEQNGRLFVLVEDFAHALGYGVISAVEFDAEGPAGVPRPVLDTGSHLSYPFVFEHCGAVWMVPESVAVGTVDLYRAVKFPDQWVKEATLLTGVEASDATLLEHDGRWWMFATVRVNPAGRADEAERNPPTMAGGAVRFAYWPYRPKIVLANVPALFYIPSTLLAEGRSHEAS
jgi:hypothetical protein